MCRGSERQQKLWLSLKSQRSSLASQVPRWYSIAMTSCIMLAHVLFGYAQASGQNTDCDQASGDQCVQAGQLSISAGGLFRGDISAHVDFDAHEILGLALSGFESVSCASLIDCPQGSETPISMHLNMTDVCILLECGGGTLHETIFHHSYWCECFT